MSDSLGDNTTPDELDQQRSVVPEDSAADPDADAPLGDRESAADEGDLVEQRLTVSGDEEEERR